MHFKVISNSISTLRSITGIQSSLKAQEVKADPTGQALQQSGRLRGEIPGARDDSKVLPRDRAHFRLSSVKTNLCEAALLPARDGCHRHQAHPKVPSREIPPKTLMDFLLQANNKYFKAIPLNFDNRVIR